MAAKSKVVPETCSDATHAELVLSGAGVPFLVLMAQEGSDCTVVNLAPLMKFAAQDPDLRKIMEQSLSHAS